MSSYDSAILADAPNGFWPLAENSGTTAVDRSGNGNNGTYQGTAGTNYTLEQTGIGDGETSVLLDGSAGYISTTTSLSGPATPLSIEVWFKTSSATQQILAEFNSAQTGQGSNQSPDLYLDSTGHLNFRIWIGSQVLITSSGTYNNGAWHHAVATVSATNAMTLYADAVNVGSNSNSTWNSNTGYWRFGTGYALQLGGNFLAGTLAKAAVYPTALTAAQVTTHFAAIPPIIFMPHAMPSGV